MAAILQPKANVSVVGLVAPSELKRGQLHEFKLQVLNNGESRKLLRVANFLPGAEFEVADIPKRLPAGSTTSLTIKFRSDTIGDFRALIVLEFHGFKIGHNISASVSDELMAQLHATSPFSKVERVDITKGLTVYETDVDDLAAPSSAYDPLVKRLVF